MKTMLRTYGYTREEAVEKSIGDLSSGIEPYTQETAKRNVAKAMAEGTHTFEWHAKKKDGELFWVEVSLKRAIIAGRDCIVSFVREIGERKKSDEILAKRLRYEKAMAACSRSLLVSTEEEEAINFTLQTLLKASGASRVYVFENFSTENNKHGLRQTHEVCAPGVTSQLDNPELIETSYEPDYMRWKGLLEKGREINGIVAELPDNEIEFFRRQEIVSLLVIPIFTGGTWYGFIGFDDTREEKVWGADEVSLLRTAAQMIGAYLLQRRTMRALTESEETFRALSDNLPGCDHALRQAITASLCQQCC